MRNSPLKQAPNGELYTTESELQRSCVRWFRSVFQARPGLVDFGLYLFSIPNGGKMGGKRNKNGVSVQAGIMVGEGLTAGVADLFLALPRCGFHGMFIEMKTPVGVWSKEQRDFASRQMIQGYAYVLCRTQKEFEKAIVEYLSERYVQIPFNEIDAKKGSRHSGQAG